MKFSVGDFMARRVPTLELGSTVKRAADLMIADETGAVVVTSEGRPIRVFAEREVLTALAGGLDLSETLVESAPRSPTVVAPSLDARGAARKLMKERGSLLVFDGGAMVGMVTTSDMLKVIFRTGALFAIDGVTSRQLVMADGRMQLKSVIKLMNVKGVGSTLVTEMKVPRSVFTEGDLLHKVIFLGRGLDEPVASASTSPLVTARVGINGREAAGAMVSRRVKRLPLTEGEKVVGIVTGRDLVQAFAYPHGIESPEVEAEYVVRYGEVCPICSTRIDEMNFCGCGAGGG